MWSTNELGADGDRTASGCTAVTERKEIGDRPGIRGHRSAVRNFGTCIVLWSHCILEMPSSLPPPSKKRKIQESQTIKEAQRLEQTLTDAINTNASLNPLADLVDLAAKVKDARDVSKAIYALYRVFVLLVNEGKLEVDGTEEAAAVKTWIREQMNRYVNVLGTLLKHEEKTIRVRQPPLPPLYMFLTRL